MTKIPEYIFIKATNYPDFEYVIDQLMELADRQNQIIDYLTDKKEGDTG